MSDDSLLNQLRDDAKTAYEELYKHFTAMLKDAHFRPRLTKTQKREEFMAFLGLPDEQQAQVIGRLAVEGVDVEKLFTDRQKLMEG